jgi:hypothetical protein
MSWLETALALLAASALLVSLVFGVFLLRRGDYAALAGVLQGLAAALAVMAALTLATRDRQVAAQRFEQQSDNERAAFDRRRAYQEVARLLLLVEEDRQAFLAKRGSRPRSAAATAQVLTLWPRRNLWGTAVDYYVESLRQPDNRYSEGREPVDITVFDRMRAEILDAIMKLEWEDRRPAASINR